MRSRNIEELRVPFLLISVLIVSLLALPTVLSKEKDNSSGPKFYPLPNGQPGFMDQAMKDFLESKAPKPTQASLDKMLSKVTKVKIQSFGSRKFIVVSDPKKIKEFCSTLKIVEDPKTFGHCMCFGNPQILLFNGNEKIAHLSCQHGFAIRWNNGWKWDANLKDGMLLTNWLAANGSPGLKQIVLEKIERNKQQKLAEIRWSKAIPKCLVEHKNFFMGNSENWVEYMPRSANEIQNSGRKRLSKFKKFWDALDKGYSNNEEMILALCHWYGSCRSWSDYFAYETLPRSLLNQIPVAEIAKALESRELTETELEGAARYFADCKSDHIKYNLPKSLNRKLLKHSLKSKDEDKVTRAKKAFIP